MPSVEFVRNLVLAAVLAVVVTACGAESPAPRPAAGDTASDRTVAEAPDSEARESSPEESQDPSVAEPEILDFSADTVVGVGSLDGAAAIEGFAADVPADLPHLLDPDGEVWRHFGVVEQSTYVVLDGDSEVVSEGYLSDAELADLESGLAG